MAFRPHRHPLSRFLPSTQAASRVIARRNESLGYQHSDGLSVHRLIRSIAHCSAVLMGSGVILLSPTPAAGHRDVDLADLGTVHPGFRIKGVGFNDNSGRSVSGAGDVNGDGLADLIVGAYAADPGGTVETSAGESYVIFGKADGTVVDLESLGLIHNGFRIDGIDSGDNSGLSVSGAGDMNGDGLADLIIGAYRAYAGGESYVVFGKSDNGAVALENLAVEAAGFRINGIAVGDHSGRSVSGAGDVNGDGLADLIIGAYKADSATEASGESYVVFGRRDSTNIELSVIAAGSNQLGFSIGGADADDASGYSVSGAGDVNGDGLADLIVGAPRADPGGESYAGESYVVFGKNDGTPINLASLGTNGFRIDGINEIDFSGYSISGAGDVNGDGLSDLLVGAYGADSDVEFSGESYVVFGKRENSAVKLSDIAAGIGGFRISGIDEGDASGFSVAGAGDVNGDGLSDVIIGTFNAGPTIHDKNANSITSELGSGITSTFLPPFGAGESYVVFGKIDGSAIDLSMLSLKGFQINGVEPGDKSGHSVSSAGDVNGDGLSDLLVGAPGSNYNAGESYIIFSTASKPPIANYYNYIRQGNAPKSAIGIIGDGSNYSTPNARCWIDFDAGDNGLGGASLQAVTLNRYRDVGWGAASTVWKIQTDRVGWATAEITLKYVTPELPQVAEENLSIYFSENIDGPFELLPTTVDVQKNHVTSTVDRFGFFAIGDKRGLDVPGSYLRTD